MIEPDLSEHVYFLQYAEENLKRALKEFDQDDAYTCINLLYHYYAFAECQEKVIDALDDEEASRCKLKKHDWIRFARNTSTHGFADDSLRNRTICPEYDFLVLRQKPSMRGLVRVYIEQHTFPFTEQ